MQDTTPKYWALLNSKDIFDAVICLDDLSEVLKNFEGKKQPNLSILYLLKKIIEQAKDQGYGK